MSDKIIGVTVGTPLPKPNFKQDDPTKGDYIKNRPDFDGLESRVDMLEQTGGGSDVSVDNTLTISGAAADAKATGDKINELGEAVGITNNVLENLSAADVGAISANGQSNELYSSIATGWLARINTNDGTNTTTVGADETGGIYAYKNGNLVWRIPPNAHSTRWTCPVKLNEFSGICELYDYGSGLLTLCFSQTNQAVTHTYLVSTSWGHATLTQLGSNGFSSYFDQDIRIMQGSSATRFIVEVKNKYDYDGDGMLNVVCSYVPLGAESVDSAVNPYTVYTAASSGTGMCSLTSKNDGIVASKFYGELVGTVSNAVAKSGDTMTGTLTIDSGNSSGYVSLSEDGEGGTIRIGSPNGTYTYEIDAHNNKSIRIHTATKHPSDVNTNFLYWNGDIGSLQTNYFMPYNPIDIAYGGTGATDAASARANLGITPANIGAISTSASCNRNWSWAGQSGTPTYVWGTNANNGADCYVWEPANFSVNYANSAGTASWANGANKANEMHAYYTGSGGAVGPNHTGASTVKCHMMNQFKGTDVWFSGTGYADVLMMNAYEWADVPYATALAIAKTNGTPRAWIASGSNTDNWAGATEVVTGNNIGWWIDGKANTSHSHSFEGFNITPSSNCSKASGLVKYYPDLKMVVFFTCLTTQVAMPQQIYHVGSIPEQYVPNARFALSAYANKSSLGPSETSGRTAGIVSIAGFIYDDGNIYVDLGADLPSGSYIWLSGTWCTI